MRLVSAAPSRFADANYDDSLHLRFRSVRRVTEALISPLSAEDCALQSMPDCSPAKWHLAHTAWFFETFVLAPSFAGYQPFNPAFRALFNSYYQTVGEPFSRPQRALLTRPTLEEILSYRHHIDEAMIAMLHQSSSLSDQLAAIIELGLNHEQQHQELILMDIKHLFSLNPLRPAYRVRSFAPALESVMQWSSYAGGLHTLGYDGDGFSFDNESPAHRVYLVPFQLASRTVTNAEFCSFIEAGGYDRAEFWLSDGWNRIRSEGWRHPLYWQQLDGEWYIHTLNGFVPLDPYEPVCHVSYYEADAYARFSGARLATEAEWEHVSSSAQIAGNFVESGRFHPTAPNTDIVGAASQLFGDAWEWTASPYSPYPGFKSNAGALGEYNGKFMSSQMVLRGGACVTPQSHIRASYRNFFPPDARWQFSGIRLAKDV